MLIFDSLIYNMYESVCEWGQFMSWGTRHNTYERFFFYINIKWFWTQGHSFSYGSKSPNQRGCCVIDIQQSWYSSEMDIYSCICISYAVTSAAICVTQGRPREGMGFGLWRRHLDYRLYCIILLAWHCISKEQ